MSTLTRFLSLPLNLALASGLIVSPGVSARADGPQAPTESTPSAVAAPANADPSRDGTLTYTVTDGHDVLHASLPADAKAGTAYTLQYCKTVDAYAGSEWCRSVPSTATTPDGVMAIFGAVKVKDNPNGGMQPSPMDFPDHVYLVSDKSGVLRAAQPSNYDPSMMAVENISFNYCTPNQVVPAVSGPKFPSAPDSFCRSASSRKFSFQELIAAERTLETKTGLIDPTNAAQLPPELKRLIDPARLKIDPTSLEIFHDVTRYISLRKALSTDTAPQFSAILADIQYRIQQMVSGATPPQDPEQVKKAIDQITALDLNLPLSAALDNAPSISDLPIASVGGKDPASAAAAAVPAATAGSATVSQHPLN